MIIGFFLEFDNLLFKLTHRNAMIVNYILEMTTIIQPENKIQKIEEREIMNLHFMYFRSYFIMVLEPISSGFPR